MAQQEQDWFAQFPDQPPVTIGEEEDWFAQFPSEEPIIEEPIVEEPEPEPSGLMNFWNKVNTPLVDINARLPEGALEAFAENNPKTAAVTKFVTDVLSGLTSPLNVATAGTFGGASAAIKAGMPTAARGLNTVGRMLSAPIAAEGVHGVVTGDTALEKTIGGIQAVGGAFGLRGISKGRLNPPEPTPPPRTNKLIQNADGTVSPDFDPAIRIDPRTGQKIETPIDKLVVAIRDSRPMTKEQAAIYAAERGERFTKADMVKTRGLEGHYERMGKMKGEHTKVVREPVKMDQADTDALVNMIEDFPEFTRPDKMNAGTGLTKLFSGEVPQLSELKLLEQVFGAENINLIKANLPKLDVKRSLFMDIVNVPRALQASFDLSFPFRQGIGLAHTAAWWKSWNPMIRSFGSEKTYRGIMDSILERPNYRRVKSPKSGNLQPSFAEKAGLKLTDLTDLASREEAIMSNIVERIPLGIGRGVRASNRAYTIFANKLRADNFDNLIIQAEKIYETAKATGKARRGFFTESFGPDQIEMLNPRKNIMLAKQIADYVNNASGRGGLGPLERSAVALNTMFFSPRLIASRLQMMNPQHYVFANPFERKQYLKSLAAMAGVWTTVASLGKMAGAEVDIEDSTNADFGKIKFGNTRLDPMAGFQQWMVLFSRLKTGEYTLSTSGETRQYGVGFGTKTRMNAIEDFIYNKLAPAPAYPVGAARATEYRPFGMADKALKLFAPILIQDLTELMHEDPDLIPLVLPASAVGMGSQTYSDRVEDNRIIPEDFDITIPQKKSIF